MAERTPTEQGDVRVGPISLSTKATFQKFPWRVKLYDMADAAALKGVAAGTATSEQQQRAMQYILVVLCAVDDMTYRPGEDGRRDSDFSEGARFVGIQIRRLINSPMDALMDWVKDKVKG